MMPGGDLSDVDGLSTGWRGRRGFWVRLYVGVGHVQLLDIRWTRVARIALHNPAKVDLEMLGEIAERSGLPAGEICLIVGDEKLDEGLQGCAIARAFVPWAGNIHGLQDHLQEDWDCGVVVGPRWALRAHEFPAYFAYLLAHELGHATTILNNLWLAAYEGMILRYVPRIVNDRKWRWDEFPHEVRYDQFGLAVAQDLYGRDAVEAEFSRLILEGLSRDAPRLVKVLTLEPSQDLSSLPRELADFASPYREQLVALWEEDIDRGTLNLGRFFRDLEALWTSDD